VGALSDERSGLSFVSQSSVLVSIYMYIYTVYVQNIIEIVLNIQYKREVCYSYGERSYVWKETVWISVKSDRKECGIAIGS
jgi:hypothetical protein